MKTAYLDAFSGLSGDMIVGAILDCGADFDEFERAISKAMASDGGAAILDLTPNNQLGLIGPWNIPETGFGGTPT